MIASLTLADRATYLQPVVQELVKQWPGNRTVTVVCHGHSVPAGYAKAPMVDSMGAYPHQLHEVLAKHYPFAVINVTVTAIGGENSVQGAKRFKLDALTHRPDVVTIDYGLNDRGVPLAESRKAWMQMVAEAKEAGAKVILLTPSPDTRSSMLDEKDPLSLQAAQIRAIASETGVGLVDAYSRFQEILRSGASLDPYMSQINHPSRAGHLEIVKLLSPWFTDPKPH